MRPGRRPRSTLARVPRPPVVHIEDALHRPGTGRARVRELPQHHAWPPTGGVGAGGGRGGPVGPGPARDLAPVTEFAIADSTFNERELRDAGYRATTTVPLLIEPGRVCRDHPTPWRRGRPQGGGADLLFVGSSPRKASTIWSRPWPPAGALRSPGPVRRWGDPQQRRVAARRWRGWAANWDCSAAWRSPLGDPRGTDRLLQGRGRLRLPLRPRRLLRPLLEAMSTSVPIVAYTTSAVPENQGAGVVLPATGAGPGGGRPSTGWFTTHPPVGPG